VKKALEGLAGVEKVEMDLERDLFLVRGASREAIFEAIRKVGYEPEDADRASFRAGEPVHPVGEIPRRIREACARARAEGKLVLVDCSAET
jgi:hypothetical protein